MALESVEMRTLPGQKSQNNGSSGGSVSVKIGRGSSTVPIGGNQSGGISGDLFITSQSVQSSNIDECSNIVILTDLVNIRKIMQVTSHKTPEPENAPIYMAYTKARGGDREPHYYILNENNRFVEVEEVNGKWKATNNVRIKPSDIIQDVANVDSALRAIDKMDNAYEDYHAQTHQHGRDLYETLYGYTNDEDYDDVNIALGALNKDNIIPYLQDYYETSGYKGDSYNIDNSSRGIMERLDIQHDAGAEITMENKKNVVKSLLAAAEDCGLQNTREYDKVKRIISRYDENGKYAEREHLRGRGKTGSWLRNLGLKFGSMGIGAGTTAVGIGIAAAFGATVTAVVFWKVIAAAALLSFAIDGLTHICEVGWYKRTDSENLDENMYKLYEKIQEMRAVPEQQQ